TLEVLLQSTASTPVDDLRITNRITIPAEDLEVRVARSSGPGGQGVNTTDSKVELRFDVAGTAVLDERQKAMVEKNLGNRITQDGVLLIQSNENRSQHRNREAARARLKMMLVEALTPPRPRRKTKPSYGAKRRRMDNKAQRGDLKRLRQKPSGE
ncbi:MAG: ribosome-associated protein, partial [Glaciecola sp.]